MYLRSWTFIVLFFITKIYCQEINRRRTSNACKEDLQCPANSYCEFNRDTSANGLCVCNENFILITEGKERKCYKVSEYGDICYKNEQCQVKSGNEAKCINGYCQCKSGSHYVKKANYCYKTSKIGEYCKFDNNCIGDDTLCKYGKCVCPYETHPNFDRTVCLKDIALGEKCSVHDECVAEDSKCHDVCRCKTSHIISTDGKECLPMAGKLYDLCDEDIQCSTNIPYSYCNLNGTCTCRENYHDVNYKCFVSVHLNEICESDENCVIPNSSCIQGRCTCNSNFFVIRQKVCSSASITRTHILITLGFLMLHFAFRRKF